MIRKTNHHKNRSFKRRSFKTLLMMGILIFSLILPSGSVFADDDDDDSDLTVPAFTVVNPTSPEEHPEEEPASPERPPASPSEDPEDEPEEEEQTPRRTETQEHEEEHPVVGQLSIKTQPKDLHLTYGQTSGNALVVEASAGVAPDAISYQWYEGNKAIQGATKSSYIIPPTRGVTSNPLIYYCEVRVGSSVVKSNTAKVSIDRRVATLQIKGSLVYNGRNQTPTIVVGNLVSGDSCEVTASASGDHKDASRSYTVTATALSNPSYALPDNPTLEYSISKKTINLVWSPNPCTFPYTGSPQAPTAATSGFAAEDAGRVQINISVPGEHKEAGNYTATATLTGPAAGNYEVSDPTQNFTITGAPTPVDKSTLNTAINTANKYCESIKSSYGDIAATLMKAIEAAKTVYNKSDATAQEVTNAVSVLTNAYNTAINEVDAAAAHAVAAKISLLPRAVDVRERDRAQIEEARDAYDALTPAQKDRITAKTLKRLTDAEAALDAIEKPKLRIYPAGNVKEYGDADPVLTYWIEEVGGSGSRIKSTDSRAEKYRIKGKLIREDGEARGTYKVKRESDMDYYEIAASLRSDKYRLTVVDDVVLTINAKTLTPDMVTLTPTSQVYTGNARKVEAVTVRANSTKLVQDTDYIIDNSSVLSAIGSATQDTVYAVKIIGRKNYTGIVTKYWTITKTGGAPAPTSTAAPSSTVQPSSTAGPSSTAQPSSTQEPSSAQPEPASSSEVTENGHLESVNTGMPEEALKKLADNTRLADAEKALKSIVGEAELQTLRDEGKQPEVQLTTKAMKAVSENEKKLAESSMSGANIQNLTAGAYLDISLSVETTGTWESVETTKEPVEFTMDVPEEFQQVSNTFYILRIHQGVASLLFDKDEDPKTITIDSDQFSTYVLMYPGKAGANTPAARNRTTIVIWILVGVVVVALLLILIIFRVRASRRRRREE